MTKSIEITKQTQTRNRTARTAPRGSWPLPARIQGRTEPSVGFPLPQTEHRQSHGARSWFSRARRVGRGS